MKQTKRIKGLLCAVFLVYTLLLIPTMTASSAGKKEEVKRTIAIVFDNSGSMYLGGNDAWCHAIYAMEVFASMMNEGDTVMIYPMHPIEVPMGGTKYNYEDNPLIIHGPGEAARIREIYTPGAGHTPIESLYGAFEDLQKTDAQEKWLILLTDGDTFWEDSYSDRVAMDAAMTRSRLSEELSKCAEKVNTMYLGMGASIDPPSFSSSVGFQTYADTAKESSATLAKLTTMCNMIFGRNELQVSGSEMEFDLPLTRLITFVQGKDLADLTLKDSSGSAMNNVSQHSPRYSEAGHGKDTDGIKNPKDDVKDTSLQGTMQSYENLAPGHYSISFSGNASSVAVYYEPDVDLAVRLLDSEGNPVDVASGTLVPGKYTLEYGLTDQNGNFTESKLLGDSQKYNLFINDNQAVSNAPKHGFHEIEVKADETLLIGASAEYLNGYYIEKNSEQLGFPVGGFKVTKRQAGSLELIVSGGQNQYTRDELPAAVYDVTVRYDGQTLTGGQLTDDILSVSEPGGGITRTIEKTGEGYRVRLGFAGAPENAAFGNYTMNFEAAYEGADGQSERSTASDSRSFELAARSAGMLEIAVSGGQSQYERSQLESQGIYQIQIKHNGEKMSAEMLDKVDLDVQLSPSGIRCETEKSGDGYRVKLLPEGSGEVPFGDYMLTVNASYTNEDGQTAESNARAGFSVIPKPAGKLELSISGGQDKYLLSELENGTFRLDLEYEGEPLSAEQLSRVKITPELSGGNAGVAVEPLADGFALRLKYNGQPKDTDEGSYQLKAAAVYTNEDGQEAKSNEVSTSFLVENDGFGITMKIVKTQAHVEIKKIDSAEPVVVQILNDGQPLTPEEFSRVNFSLKLKEGSKLFYTIEEKPEDSAFEIHLDPAGKWEIGNQKFTCIAQGTDPVGSEFKVEKDSNVDIIPFAMWIKYAGIGGAILLLLILFLLFMNMKVLPKGYGSQNWVVTIDGQEIEGLKGNMKLNGRGKRKGSVEFKTPSSPDYAGAYGGIRLDVEALNNRWTSSKSRTMKVVNSAVVNAGAVSNYSVGSHGFSKDPATGHFVSDNGDTPQQYWAKGNKVIRHNTSFEVSGSINEGRTIEFSCTANAVHKK